MFSLMIRIISIILSSFYKVQNDSNNFGPGVYLLIKVGVGGDKFFGVGVGVGVWKRFFSVF